MTLAPPRLLKGSSLPARRPLLVASDLDGTLLAFDGQVVPGIRQGIKALLDAGVRFVLSTGRMFRSARAAAAGLGLDRGVIVCYQGAMVAELDGGRRLLERPLLAEMAAEVVRHARAIDRHVNAYVDDSLHVESLDEWAERYMKHGGVGAVLVTDLEALVLSTPPHKLLIMTDAEEALALAPELQRRWFGRLTVTLSQPGYIEITDPSASKRNALQYLAQQLGVAHERSAACGDGLNDIDMLEWAGLGVAVAESDERVWEAADVVVRRDELGELLKHLARLPGA